MSEDECFVFPDVKNIGWLSGEREFDSGRVDDDIVAKIKKLFFLSMSRHNDVKPILSYEFVRSPPILCPLCQKKIELVKEDDEESLILGNGQITIPSVEGNSFFLFPNMLIHYINFHGFLPPHSFLSAVDCLSDEYSYKVESLFESLQSYSVNGKEIKGF